ncbi:ankyrin repeat domain-containing protein [Shewanella sp. CAL98-MNA-CIBAN-0140]|uniref:ankyrin repeat domain-containing protein n=1 Tax=unclassified Shewanella TaxID=196818 RepID=UPI003326BD54
MKAKALLIGILILIAAYVAGAIYTLSNSKIESVIISGAGEDGLYIPNAISHAYLMNFRLRDSDIKELESRAGIATLFGVQDEDRKYLYLDSFIKNGASVNAESVISGLPPLHAALLFNDSKLVHFLILRGAETKQKNTQFGMNAHDFVKHLQAKKPLIDRSDVLIALSL